MGLHPSHKTRFSWDASTYDKICVYCGATDETPGGWGQLAEPCTCTPEEKQAIDERRRKREEPKEKDGSNAPKK